MAAVASMAPNLPPSPVPGSPILEDGELDPKRKRRRTSPEQLKILEAVFATNPHPSQALRNQLAIQLRLTPRSVQIWFQNRRAKARNAETNPPPPKDVHVTLFQNMFQTGNEASQTQPLYTGPRYITQNKGKVSTIKHDINSTDSPFGVSFLHYCAVTGFEKKVAELISSGADPNIQDEHGNTPLLGAVYASQANITEYLLMHGAKPNLTNDAGESPLYAAARSGNVQLVETLLKHGADINIQEHAEGETALHIAALHGHEALCSMLLQHGVMVNVVDHRKCTPLHHAAVYGHLKIVTLLVDHKALLEPKDRQGRTPLHAAALGGNEKVVNFLVSSGADPNCQDSEGFTPLHYAVSEEHEETVNELIACGASVTIKSHNGVIPLHVAARKRKEGIFNLLLRLDPQTFQQATTEGQTPLHFAAMAGKLKFVSILLDKGAEHTCRDTSNHTPLEYAQNFGHTKTANLLSTIDQDMIIDEKPQDLDIPSENEKL